MTQPLPGRLLEVLSDLDTPTICNALELLVDQPFTTGYTGLGIRCLTPPKGVVGYAVTAKLTMARPPSRSCIPVPMGQYLDNIASVPGPRMAVLCDVDDPPGRAAALGDVMANYHRAMGCVAMVTNGAVRDLTGVAATGIACYGAGVVPSHGYFHYLSTGEPVLITGLDVHQGELLVGDEHGLVRVPANVAEEIPTVCERIRRREARLISYCQSSAFTPAGFSELCQADS